MMIEPCLECLFLYPLINKNEITLEEVIQLKRSFLEDEEWQNIIFLPFSRREIIECFLFYRQHFNMNHTKERGWIFSKKDSDDKFFSEDRIDRIYGEFAFDVWNTEELMKYTNKQYDANEMFKKFKVKLMK